MRLLSLVFGLAIVAWLVYSYLDSGKTIDMNGDKTIKQQSQQTLQQAQDAANDLQRSLQQSQQNLEKQE